MPAGQRNDPALEISGRVKNGLDVPGRNEGQLCPDGHAQFIPPRPVHERSQLPTRSLRPDPGGDLGREGILSPVPTEIVHSHESTPVALSAVASCSTPIRVARVSPSAIPSTRAGRQWRWKASTVRRVWSS